MSTQQEHEEALIRAFILPQRQDRYLELLARPKRRKDILAELPHFKLLDMRRAVAIPPSQQHAGDILRILKDKGAPELCYALSQDSGLDGRKLVLAEDLNHILGREIETFLSCIAGKLAYFEDEDQRRILERMEKR